MSNLKLLFSVENAGLSGDPVTVPLSTGIEVSVLDTDLPHKTYGAEIPTGWGNISLEVPVTEVPDLLFLRQEGAGGVVVIHRSKVYQLIDALFRLKVEVMDK